MITGGSTALSEKGSCTRKDALILLCWIYLLSALKTCLNSESKTIGMTIGDAALKNGQQKSDMRNDIQTSFVECSNKIDLVFLI